MSLFISFAGQAALTLMICLLIVKLINPFLRRILVDLCAGEDRGQFWTVFTNILLVGGPMAIALAYHPRASDSPDLFFEAMGRLSGNLLGFLFTLAGVGVMICIFALFAPRPAKVEAQ